MSIDFLQHMATLIYLPLVLLTAAGIGNLVLKKTNLNFFSAGEAFIFAAGIGFGLLGYMVFLLVLSEKLYAPFVYLFLFFIVAASCIGWYITRKFPPYTHSGSAGLSLRDKWLFVPLSILFCAGAIHVLTPAIGNDALTYHLAVPKLYIENNGFYFIPGNIFSNYPIHTEMLFLLGLMTQSDVLAKIIHFSMAILVFSAMLHFARHHTRGMASSVLGPLIFFSIPSVFVNAHMAYNDLAMAMYSFLAFFGFMNWHEKQKKGWLVLCGIFSGLTVATKYSGLLLPLLGCLGILYVVRKKKGNSRQAFSYLLSYSTVVAIAGSPFYIKNVLLTGNPLYPFFYDIFGGPGWSSEQAGFYNYFLYHLGMGRNFIDYLLLPWNLSINAQMHSPLFDGVIGPVFLLTLPFAAGLKKPAPEIKIILVYCLFFFLFWAFSAQQIRYLSPIFPLLAILTAYITRSYQKAYKPVFFFLIILIAGSLIHNTWHISKEFRAIRPDRFVFGFENRKAFLTRLIPSYSMFQHINSHLPEKSKVFFIYMKNLGYLCQKPYYSDSMFESYTIEKILDRSQTPEQVLTALKELQFTHILYDIQYTTGNLSTLSAENKRHFINFQKKYMTLVHQEKNRFFLYKIAGKSSST